MLFIEFGYDVFMTCMLSLKLPWPFSLPSLIQISLVGIAPCHVRPPSVLYTLHSPIILSLVIKLVPEMCR